MPWMLLCSDTSFIGLWWTNAHCNFHNHCNFNLSHFFHTAFVHNNDFHPQFYCRFLPWETAAVVEKSRKSHCTSVQRRTMTQLKSNIRNNWVAKKLYTDGMGEEREEVKWNKGKAETHWGKWGRERKDLHCMFSGTNGTFTTSLWVCPLTSTLLGTGQFVGISTVCSQVLTCTEQSWFGTRGTGPFRRVS